MFFTSTAVLNSAGNITYNENEMEACEICLCRTMTQEMYVSCKSRNLTKVPKNLPEDTVYLNLANNQLERLYEDDFANLSLLRVIQLDDNKLMGLPKNLFKNCVEITGLSLARNRLRKLPEILFAKTSNLGAIDLSENLLETLPENIFSFPNNLEDIYLFNNLLETLSPNLFAFTNNLQTLSFSRNRLRKLPEGIFARTNNLENIYFSNNFLEALPKDIFTYTSKLKSVYFSNNSLETLPGNIFTFTNKLESVVLNSNSLKYLPENIFLNTPILKFLNISNNLLETLPVNIFAVTNNLECLHLSNNLLHTLPANLFSSTNNLQCIYLENNRLQTLPANIFAFAYNLSYVSLSSNLLVTLPENIFAFSNNYTHIDLSNNLLDTLPENTFPFINEPFEILLDRNRLTYLPERLFENCVNLEGVRLNGNRLQELPDNLFANNTNLRILESSSNHLETLPANIFASTRKLEALVLENNSLTYLPENVFFNAPILRVLALGKNRLQELPERLFTNIRNLQWIDLSGNRLTSLPANIFPFTKHLTAIDLSGNLLETLPEDIFAFTINLDALVVENNVLKYLPERVFFNTPRLRMLNLAGNNLTSIPERLLINTPNIEILQIVGTRVENIPKGLFKKVNGFQLLFLADNNITTLPRALFSDVHLTGALDLSINRIEEIPLELFNSYSRSHSLTDLFLHKNLIKYLQNGVFRGLPSLKTVCLFENQIQVIEANVFFTTSVKVYLFANMLGHFSYDSFNGDLQGTEIHLYRNNITTITGNVTRKMPGSNILYMDCWNLKEVHKVNIQLKCIRGKITPEIHLYSEYDAYFHLIKTLMKERFTCIINVQTKAIKCNRPLCPQGTYANWRNDCIKCPKGGFYQDEIGSTSNAPGAFVCKPCVNGTYVRQDGGGSPKDCVECPDGTNKSLHAGFRACFCKNDFARKDRFGHCSRCEQPGVECIGQDFQSLKPGYNWYWSFPNANIDEYNAFVFNLLNDTRFYDENTQYLKDIPRVHKCPRHESCVSNFYEDKSVEGRCADGYTGWVCSKCEPGYYSVSSSCLRCFSIRLLFFELALIFCVVIMIAYSIWENFFIEKKMSSERSTADFFLSRLKILLGFYQVIGKHMSSSNNTKFSRTAQVTSEIVSMVEMNVLKLFLRPQCFNRRFLMNPKVEFIIAMASLITIISITFVAYKILRACFNTKYRGENLYSKVTNLKGRTLTFVVIMIFITYPPICSSIFNLLPFACKSFCLDLKNKHCFSALRSDYDMRCNEQLLLYQVLAVVAIVGYVVGFPLTLLYTLRKYCSALHLQEGKGQNVSTTKRITKPTNTKDKTCCNLPQCFKFFYENYKSGYWYWEIVELARKVTQTGLITIYGWRNRFTVLLTIGLSVVFLLIHARYRPMKSGREQWLQMLSLTAILTNVVFIAVKMPNKNSDMFSLILIVLHMSVIVIVCLEALVAAVIQLKVIFIQRSRFNLQKTSKGSTRFAKGNRKKLNKKVQITAAKECHIP